MYLDVGLRALLGVVFLVAAAGKLRSGEVRSELAEAVDVLLAIGEGPARAAAWAVTLVELASVVLLAVPATAAIGFVLSALVLAAFTAVLASGLRNGRSVQCRCFGMDGSTVGASHLARNGLLITCAFAGLALAGAATGDGAGALVLAALSGALAGWVLTRWDDVVFLLARPATPATSEQGAI